MRPAAHRDQPQPGRRVHVVGTTCAGKTTLAAALAAISGIPHVELDALQWGPGWTPAPTEELRRSTADALRGEAWTVDGNYGSLRDIIWARADTVVWLDFPLPVVLWRMLKRTTRRIAFREELWGGNRETLRSWLCSRDSLILWAFKTHGKHQRLYPELLARPEHAHLTAVRLTGPRAADAWLAGVVESRPLDRA